MSDSTRRALRGILDLIPAGIAAVLIMVPVLGLEASQVAAVTAFLSALVVALAKIRNALEDAGYLPALLKAPASDGENPVPEPDPQDWVNASLADQRKRALGD